MSDVIDEAQGLEIRDRDGALAAVLARGIPTGDADQVDCDDCGEEIETERRAALPGVRTCVVCQEARERRRRLYREG